MLLVSILVVIALRSSNGFKIPGVETIFDLDGYYELIKEVVSKGQFAADRGEGINLFDNRCEVMLGELLNKVDELSEKVDLMNDRIMERLDGLENVARGIADEVHNKFLLHKVIDSMKIVFGKHALFIRYSKMKKIPYKKFTKFLQDCVSSGSEGVEEELNKIYRIIVRGQETSGIEETMLDVMENVFRAKNDERCDQKSPQHSLYTLYTTVAATELMGFTTIVYAAKLLEKETKNEETDSEIQFFNDGIRIRMEDYVHTFRNAIKRVSRMFRTCDPDKSNHVRGETFVEMWGIVQLIAMEEFDLVEADSCRGECEGVRTERADRKICILKRGHTTDWVGYFPQNLDLCTIPRKCMGTIHSCRSIWSGNYCRLRNSTRRYDFLQDSWSGGKVFGKWSECKGGVYSHFDWSIYEQRDCGMCMCICDDDVPESLSVHTINLRESVSHYESNRVVVGMKIQEENRILQIQVREGEIGREFSIKNTTLQWIPIPELIPENAKPEIDYHMFKLDHAFNMDEIVLSDNRVVVGVKFAKSERKERETAHIEIQVKSMAYNPATGKLLQGTDQWEKSTVIHDSKMDISGLIPQSAKARTVLRTEFNQYVKMRISDYDEDFGQTTLPLFDAHVVETKPLSPFGGLGLHYRAVYEHGGFIGLSGYSLDYVSFLDHSEDNQSSDLNDVLGPE